ncbi:DUF805 domain-containing protein [Novosphingobium sp. Rr 2-17]|uniref:DUF805 domain-containing protein n=1 Tax=Novosphingobium sp. Rr 2-17 TaxID=555793 RepID=UPI0012F673D7|nr:DUF805 domain-containing protein [Novosphingobium sp. Rr 2-17]
MIHRYVGRIEGYVLIVARGEDSTCVGNKIVFLPFLPLKRYAEFHGRSSRAEYWSFVAFISIGYAAIVAMLAASVSGSLNETYSEQTISALTYFLSRFAIIPYTLAIFVPYFAVLVRRLHDQGRTGWWLITLLFPYLGVPILWVLTCIEGTVGPNRFGPDPKA